MIDARHSGPGYRVFKDQHGLWVAKAWANGRQVEVAPFRSREVALRQAQRELEQLQGDAS